MERYKDFLIEAWSLGKDDHWEPRFAVHSSDGQPTDPLNSSILLIHEKTHAGALSTAAAAAKRYIDDDV
jgi:hypothetical protein